MRYQRGLGFIHQLEEGMELYLHTPNGRITCAFVGFGLKKGPPVFSSWRDLFDWCDTCPTVDISVKDWDYESEIATLYVRNKETMSVIGLTLGWSGNKEYFEFEDEFVDSICLKKAV